MGNYSSAILFLAQHFLILCLMSREILVCNGDSNVVCSESEQKALTRFKNGLNDPENRLSSWRGQDCCKWRGVGCNNSTGNVIRIDLRNPHPYNPYKFDSATFNRYGFWNLSGQIDPALLELKYLQYLDLSGNTFDNILIPEFVGSFKELQHLNLSKAGFSGMIPFQLGNVSSLLSLDLSSSGFPRLTTDSLQWVATLYSLRHLSMNNVDLSMVENNWFQVINRLSFLVELGLSGCDLSGIIPSLPFVNFTSLAVVDLSLNAFKSAIPSWFVNISNLESLDLTSNSFYGLIPLGFSELPYLQNLNLALNSNLSADCSKLFMGSWRKIRILELGANKVYGNLPIAVGNMTSIVTLDLFANNVGGGIPSSIGNLCNLEILNFAGNNLTGEIPEFLEKTNCSSKNPLPHLMYLSLNNNQLKGNLPDWLGQLENLVELNLQYNLLQGPIPPSLGKLSFLTDLSLAGNNLNGTVPRTLGQLSELVTFDVSFNQLSGIISEDHFSMLGNLKFLHISSNSLILNVSSDWNPPFQVRNLDMGSCYLGPRFPSWLATQKDVVFLDFSNASISDAIPNWFWDISSNLSLLNISFNRIQGHLPNPWNVVAFADIDLSSNLLQGLIQLPSSTVELLDLSSNQFYGPIPQNIGEVMPDLIFLSLSSNNLTGKIPMSIGDMLLLEVLDLSRNNLIGAIPSSLGNCSYLKALDLENNNISGGIPRSLGLLKQLHTLHLRNNKVSGEFPLSLKNCSSLETLDLAKNEFSGSVPSWVGENLVSLRILSLRSNTFSGEIPPQLSNLTSLQVLDLAENNLWGTIPQSFGNLRAMAQVSTVNQYWFFGKYRGRYYEESFPVSMKGMTLEYNKTLSLVTSIDLSRNNLSGYFPDVLTNLSGLLVLNLSENHLSGNIPTSIVSLKELASLDVSSNQLSGDIPSSMSSMTFLSYLNFSNNNFSGKIPSRGQMSTFDASSYSGNPDLCGFPLSTMCPGESLPPRAIEDEEDGDSSEDFWLYISAALGFATGLLGLCAVLVIRSSWTDAYFHFIDKIIGGLVKRIF